jgi:hypothetical protein
MFEGATLKSTLTQVHLDLCLKMTFRLNKFIRLHYYTIHAINTIFD